MAYKSPAERWSNRRMTSLQNSTAAHPSLNKILAWLALAVGLTGCSNVHTGAGIGVNVPILPGVSIGVNVGTGGVSAGVNAQSGPVGVGASTPGPVSVGGGVGVGGVLYDPKK